ncbi:MAG: PAS domain-containing protein [Gallionellaceae bacterium]
MMKTTLRHEPPVWLLDESGMIQDSSKSVEELFGYRQSELVWQHISCLIPQLSEVVLIQKGRVNRQIEFICHCGHIFMGLNRNGDTFPNELSFILLEHEGLHTLRLIVRPLTADNQNYLMAS